MKARMAGVAVALLAFLAQVPVGAQTASHADVIRSQVDRAGGRIRSLGEKDFPAVYAGVSVDEVAGTVDLRVTSLGRAASTMMSSAGGVPVIVEIVPRSHAALMSLQQDVIRDESYWSSRRVTLTDFGPDIPSDTLSIGIEPYTAPAAAAFRARYGPQNVTVVRGIRVEPTADRNHDTSPWNGGDYVTDNHSSCTTGFGVNNYSYQSGTGNYLILAGHCFGNGVAVYHNGTRMGTVSRSSNIYKDNGMDIELIAAGSSRHIWETNTTTADSNDSAGEPALGSSICHSGIATNKRCGTVSSLDHCYLLGSIHVCHQDLVTSTGLLVAAGDSGGPWFDAYTDAKGVRRFDALGVQSGGAASFVCTDQLGTNQQCYKQATISDPSWIFGYGNAYPTFWVNFS